jgi:hypothetical protein
MSLWLMRMLANVVEPTEEDLVLRVFFLTNDGN